MAGALYADLRRLASSYFAAERPDHTLQPTALVHEAILKLAQGAIVKDSNHLLALAANAMRQVLVDHARSRGAAKRSPGGHLIELNERLSPARGDPAEAIVDVISLDEAIAKLERMDPRMAELVTLRFFAGLTVQQAAIVLGVSDFTAERDWRIARAWLADHLAER